ncbi:hypothetical protein ACWDSJ_26420 [Nocardia sp. NPDC003482]
MNIGHHSYTARLRVPPGYADVLADPGPHAAVLVLGYRAAFATHPDPGTVISAFRGIDTHTAQRSALAPMALIAVEIATAVLTTGPDGSTETEWEADPFAIFGRTGFHWYLTPAEPAPDGHLRLTERRWAASGYEAILPRTVLAHVPTAPPTVPVHDRDPHTGAQRHWRR